LSQQTHVVIKAKDSGLAQDSMVLCENPVCVSKQRLIRYLTTVRPQQLEEVATAYLLSTGVLSSLSDEQLINIRKKALSLDSLLIA